MDAPRSAPIGKAIRRARERLRMSQADAARALGVSRSALNAWENDRAYPRSSIGALEELYGVSLDDDAPEPVPALSEKTKKQMRDELGDEVASALIAHAEHLASGRTSEAGDGPRPGSAPTGSREAG